MIAELLLKNNKKAYRNDGLKRSIVKTLSWRIIGTLDTFLIAYLITGTTDQAITIGGIELITKMALYFFHERTWNKIQWGKKNW